MLAFSFLCIEKTSRRHFLSLENGGGTLQIALFPNLLGGWLPFFAIDNAVICKDSYTDFQLGVGDTF